MARGKDSKRKSSCHGRERGDNEANENENKQMRHNETSGSRSRLLSRQWLPKKKPKSSKDGAVSIRCDDNSYV